MERSEALKIVKEYYPSSGKDLNEAVETLIPELKESEDERIKNFLIGKFREIGEVWHEYSTKDIIAWLEKQGSQNLANSEKTCKVEPKFKVGDWVINTITNEVEQIIDITDSEYICSGHLIVSFNNQPLLKRWTIQDAKDGDVLDFDCGIGIFKNISTDGYNAHCYCYYDRNSQLETDARGLYLYDVYKAEPATKEQRDHLFQKMKESGYEWDAEKKELKKIEQDPAWSEEDEHRVTDTIYFLDTAKKHYAGTEELDACIYWLKALKERCTWKPSDLPHWKKSTLPDAEVVTGFNSDYFYHKGYIINYKELFEKLPKDD